MLDDNQFGDQLLHKAFRSLGLSVLILAVLLFLPAWDIFWLNGWIFLSLLTALILAAIPYLWITNPEIFVARRKIQPGTKAWDKVLLRVLFASLVLIIPLAGFDYRFHWSLVPSWLMGLGYVLFAIGFVASIWVQRVNKFAEPGVRIQTERGQTVIDNGPYAIVRHPLYLADLFLFSRIPLALGSIWAFIPVAVGVGVLIVRTVLEDRLLHKELAEYQEYAARVRYRLIPGVW